MTVSAVRRAVAAVAAAGVVVAGCSASEPEDGTGATRRWTSTDTTFDGRGTVFQAGEPTALGSKWNWEQRSTFPFISETRGGATFFETQWCEIGVAPQGRDWSRVDEIVDRAQQLGYTIMLKIRTGGCPELGTSSARGEAGDDNLRKTPSALPQDLRAYSAYVSEFVERYSARGVTTYAVENEIDTQTFWTGDVGDYAPLARAAAAAIRAADPDAVVLDAGVSSTAYGVARAADLLAEGQAEEAVSVYSAYYARRQAGDASRFPEVDSAAELESVVEGDRGRRAVEAVDLMVALADEGVIDAYQLHFYEPWQQLRPLLDWLDDRLPQDTPMQAWEVGVAWPGDTYDSREHATDTVKLLTTLLGADISPVVYLPVAFTPRAGRDQVFRGLLHADGTRLPAATAFRALVGATAGATATLPVDDGGLQGVALDHDGATAMVVWADRTVTVALAEAAGVRVRDVSGREVEWPSEGLTVGAEPLVITWPAPPVDVVAQVTAAVD